jgi:osmotically-inducible protein OsmY
VKGDLGQDFLEGEIKMKTDVELRKNIEDEIQWEPSVLTTDIGIIVKDGVVTLTGSVDSFPEKLEAENAAKRVDGVKGVVNKIEVKLSTGMHLSDEYIASAASNALAWNIVVPENLEAEVEDGWITLTGIVEWRYQKRAAEEAVRGLTGVKGVINNITVKPHIAPLIVKGKIEAALTRNAFLDSKGIQVKIDGGKVTLEGTVYSWLEREQAEDAAWSAPGVTEVDNKLVVY